MKPIRLMSGFFTVGLWTLLSRVLGFLRDAMILAYLGTGPQYQAYVVAFRLPNMFRRFFAEGAFNMAFVPIYAKKLEADDDPNGFASEAFSGLASVLILLTLAAQIAMPWLIYIMASGFAGQQEFALSVDYGRVVFPYILFISLAALLSGALNAMGRFAAAAAAPVLLNVILVIAMGIAAAAGWDVANALIWGIPFAGIAQLVLVWEAARRAGLTLKLHAPRLTPEMRRLIRVALPAALAGGVVQVNLLVGQQVASYFDHAVGWLFAADRLYQLPLGVIGIAVGVVLLPDLSRRLRAQDDAGARDAFSRAGEIALALTMPAAIALVVIPLPLVSVLFERGEMTRADSIAIAAAVAIYGIGLPSFVLQKVLQPLYYAREDTKTPFRYAVIAMIINAVLAIGLSFVGWIGWLAPAIATSLASWVMCWLLWRGSASMGEVARFDARFRDRLWRIIVASVAMGLLLLAVETLLGEWLYRDGLRYLALILLVGAGMAGYAVFAHLTGALPFRELKRLARR